MGYATISETVLAAKRRARFYYDGILTEFNYRRASQFEYASDGTLAPSVLHIEAINVCNAKCVFCAYPKMKRAKGKMPLALFRRVIAEYVAMGGRRVSLTPIVGDPLLDAELFKRLDILQAYPEIERFSFYTNAIALLPALQRRLLDYGNRLGMTISWGGFDRATYLTYMNVDRFDIVRDNVLEFLALRRDHGVPLPVSIALRSPRASWRGPTWRSLKAFEQQGLLRFTFVDEYDSWAGQITASEMRGLPVAPMPHKRGVCERLLGKPVVLADGTVNACACRDVEAQLPIGDLTQSTLAQVMSGTAINDLIGRHMRGDFPPVCERCTYYRSVYSPRLRGDAARWETPQIPARQTSESASG